MNNRTSCLRHVGAQSCCARSKSPSRFRALRVKAVASSILAALFLMTCRQSACAATEPGPPHGEVIRNDIIGVVLYPDGETPVTDLPVKVWGLDEKKMVYRTKTDRMGVFRIPKLNTDRFYIFVGSVKIDIRILASRADALVQHHDIVVITARPIVIARPMFFDLLIGPSLLLFPEENIASP